MRVAATADMTETSGMFGRKFVGAGELETPSGRTALAVETLQAHQVAPVRGRQILHVRPLTAA